MQIKSTDLEMNPEIFKKAFLGAPFSMFVHEVDTGEIIMANPAAISSFGLNSMEELQDFDPWLEPPYSFEDVLSWIKKASSEGPQRFQWMSRKATGEVLWEDVYMSIISVGGENMVLAGCLDISEKLEVLEKMKEKEEKYRIIADFTADCEYWQLPDGSISYISPTCEKITGYSREDFISDPDLFLKIIHPDDREKAVCLLPDRKARIQEDHNEVEFRIRARDGRESWIGHKCRPVFSSRGRYMGRRVSNRDITEKKDREKDLQDFALELKKRNQALDEALEKSRAMDQTGSAIIENTAHKVRNPMNAALGFARVLENDSGLNQEQAGLVRNIIRGLEQVLETVSSLREVSRGLAGQDDARRNVALPGDEHLLSDLSLEPVEARPQTVLDGKMEQAVTLPGELASDMLDAVSNGDMNCLEGLIDQMGPEYGDMANILGKLALNYEYENLENILKKGAPASK